VYFAISLTCNFKSTDMKKVAILFVIVLTSCSTNNFKKKNLLPIDSNLNFVISNESQSIGDRDFLSLFGIAQNAKDVKINFDSSGDFRITYKNPYLKGDQFQAFKGKFKKKFFEIYLEKKRVVAPPIYWVTQINRLRIAIEKDSTLVVERHYDHSGMILFMGAGSTFTSVQRYSKID